MGKSFPNRIRKGLDLSDVAHHLAQRKIYFVSVLAVTLPFALLFIVFSKAPAPPRAGFVSPLPSHDLPYRKESTKSRANVEFASKSQLKTVKGGPNETVKSKARSVKKFKDPPDDVGGAKIKMAHVTLESKGTLEDELLPIPSLKRRDPVKSSSDTAKKPSHDKLTSHQTDLTILEELEGKENTRSGIKNKTRSRKTSSKSNIEENLWGLDMDTDVSFVEEKTNSGPTVPTKTNYLREPAPIVKESDEDLYLTDGYKISNNDEAIRNKDEAQVIRKTATKTKGSAVQCDLSKGRWVPDPEGPSYSTESCAYIQGHQNCLKNGRKNTDYLFWRWKPDGCKLKRFDATTFLKMMKKKSMAFVGDSIARNQMQSLLCLLSQVESPEEVFRDKNSQTMAWHFPSSNFNLSVFWAPYLIKNTEDEINGIPTGITKLHLDILEKDWTIFLPKLDVAVISAGQWYYKNSIYLVKGQVIGCHNCQGANKDIKQIGFYDAFRAALKSAFRGVSTMPGYKGITLFRTFAVDHFEGGTWEEGGNCRRTKPFLNNSMQWQGINNNMNKEMYSIQKEEFNKAMKEGFPNGSNLKLIDTTYSAFLRPDGHPDQFRELDFVVSSQKENRLVPSDCLHWCLPGPIDTWNEFLLQVLKQSE